MHDLHLRRVTETATTRSKKISEGDAPQETKALPWDNLALRERMAESEVAHRSVTSELHTAARLATQGGATPAPRTRGTWSEESPGPRPIPAAPRHDPRPAPVPAPAREPWWKRLSDGLNLTGSAYRAP